MLALPIINYGVEWLNQYRKHLQKKLLTRLGRTNPMEVADVIEQILNSEPLRDVWEVMWSRTSFSKLSVLRASVTMLTRWSWLMMKEYGWWDAFLPYPMYVIFLSWRPLKENFLKEKVAN
jgi:hypothetical protein